MHLVQLGLTHMAVVYLDKLPSLGYYEVIGMDICKRLCAKDHLLQLSHFFPICEISQVLFCLRAELSLELFVSTLLSERLVLLVRDDIYTTFVVWF